MVSLKTKISFDIDNIIKILQSLSDEVDLHGLIKKFMSLTIEYTGAEKSLLILKNKNKWLVEAEISLKQNISKIGHSASYINNNYLPSFIINTVKYSQKSIILKNAATDKTYKTDDYIANNQIKSLLCCPLHLQNRLIGVLYLENNQTTNVFTEQRIEILKVINTQAIALIEKAQLYENLEHKINSNKEEYEVLNEELRAINKDLKHEIKECEKIEKDLRESKEKFIAIFERSVDGILVAEKEKKTFTFANPAICKMTGFSELEFKKMSINDIHSKNDLPFVIKQFEKQARNEIDIATSIPIQRKDKSIFYADIGSSTFKYKDKNYIVGIFRDNTERRLTEQKLLQSKQLLEKIAENYPNSFISIIEKDLSIGFSAGQEFTKLGINPNDFVGQTLEQIFGEQTATVKNYYIKTFEGEECLFELFINNQYQCYKTIPLYDGNEINEILVVVENITERKLAVQTLKESEEKFRSIFKESNSIELLVNPENGKIFDANQSACNFYGYTYQELTSMKIQDINQYSEAEIVREMQNAKNKNINYFHFKHKLSNNDIKDVEVYSNPLTVDNKKILFSIIHDITERKQAEQALKESEQKLKISNAEKDKFFSLIAHDLKSPFSSMLGFSQLLYNNFDKYDVPKQKKFIQSIYKSVKNTHKLLENLLLWSLSQNGTIDFNPEPLNLYLLTTGIVDLLQQGAENKSITIKNNVSKNITVNADSNMLSTIIRNLISNAIKFTLQNGIITIDAITKDDNIRNRTEISITDNGIGIHPEIKAQIFEITENISTQGTENETGTGLGLILCKEFMTKHNGDIRVESKLGEGSKFIFTI